MNPKPQDFRGLIASEPARTRFVLKVGLAGAFVIVLWSWLGGFVVSAVLAALITTGLIIAYGGVLAFLAASLVRSVDRWQVESALHARRLMATGKRAEMVAADEPADDGFLRLYFLLRLQDELRHCRQYGRPMSVLALKVMSPGQEPSAALTEQISFDVANLAASHVQTISLTTSLAGNEYIFCLPRSDKASAKALASTFLTALGEYWCYAGLAVYPEDASEAEALIEFARRQYAEAA